MMECVMRMLSNALHEHRKEKEKKRDGGKRDWDRNRSRLLVRSFIIFIRHDNIFEHILCARWEQQWLW